MFVRRRNDGLGLAPSEAMPYERPVTAAVWSGNLDFIDAQSSALVGYAEVPAIDPLDVLESQGVICPEPAAAQAPQGYPDCPSAFEQTISCEHARVAMAELVECNRRRCRSSRKIAKVAEGAAK